MGSIRQNTRQLLPDWRNLGVLLRALLGVNLLALAAALVYAHSLQGWLSAFVENAAWVEPLLFINLGFLALSRDLLWRLRPRTGQALALIFATFSGLLLQDSWRFIGLAEADSPLWRAALLSLAAACALLAYFEWRSKALSPRLEEARLSALNARIRPHFLFNALNTVIALIRSDPRGAENALENLSELFRALLKNPRELSPLSAEIALGRQYLELEKLRLGDRLQVSWEIEALPQETLVPPLMLQPLLENAVYHGIESTAEGGEILVRLGMAGEMLQLDVSNSLGDDATTTITRHRPGNHMALKNIRERLALYYDMEASLEHGKRHGRYRVHIELPCRTHSFSVFD
ncbi:alginate O-acetyltransferase [Betaproteobacteria bacterium]|nr:alginate O-acetyltransferase [Betaproteobacteria bacterium]GHU47225.1 alginate O-acetyltransferase [Betaproteobacteria bacterium]